MQQLPGPTLVLTGLLQYVGLWIIHAEYGMVIPHKYGLYLNFRAILIFLSDIISRVVSCKYLCDFGRFVGTNIVFVIIPLYK